jgi:Tfp pilus assembly PilM family ATPase
VTPRSGRSPIGLDVGPRSIAALQVHRARGADRMEAAAIIGRPNDAGAVPTAEELIRLQDILYRQGFSGRRVVLAVPDARLVSGTIELPPATSGAPLEQLARTELARMHRKDPDGLETASWRIPAPMRAGNYSHMMAVAAPREDVERTLDAAEAAGLVPLAIDARAWAMARACRPLLQDTSNVSAILDLSEAEAVLSVVHSGTVVYERLMSDSGISKLRLLLRTKLELEADIADHILESVGLASGAELPEESRDRAKQAAELIREYFGGLFQEFRTALAYAVHRYPSEVDRVLLHGVGAAIPGLAGVIADELDEEITIVTPDGLTLCPEWLRDACRSPALTTALGLALHPEGVAA